MPRPNEEIEQILNETRKGWHRINVWRAKSLESLFIVKLGERLKSSSFYVSSHFNFFCFYESGVHCWFVDINII